MMNRALNCAAAGTNDFPHFQEVLRLLRANLPSVSEEELNRALVQGLLDRFYPRVILVTNAPSAKTPSQGPRLSQTTVYDQSYGYLRVTRVAAGLADQIQSAYEKLDSTNKLKGLVLDLRFAGGQDYAAAANAADRFLTVERPLLDWEDASARSTTKTDAIHVPLTVLVNQQTAGAAEALAAALRETDAALLIGSPTAGQAEIFKEFDLTGGQRLRIATGRIRVGSGMALSATGVAPDIEVSVSGEDERAYFADPLKVLPRLAAEVRATNNAAQAGSTNRVSRRRLNEAELVRLQREGFNPDEEDGAGPAPRAEGDASELVVRDPALARALDLLKGIAIVERSLPR